MSLTLAAPDAPRPQLRAATGLRLAPVGTSRWRVVDATGRIIGHLDAIHDPRGTRYRARRYHAGAHAFRDVGDFWSADDAAACLRFAR